MLKQSGFGNLAHAHHHPLPGAASQFSYTSWEYQQTHSISLGQTGFQVGMSARLFLPVPKGGQKGLSPAQDWLCHREDMKQPVCSCHTFTVSGVTGSAESNLGHSRNRAPSEAPDSRDVTTSLSHFGAITCSDAKLCFHPLALPTQNSSCSWPGHAQTRPVEELTLLTPNLCRERSSLKGRHCC